MLSAQALTIFFNFFQAGNLAEYYFDNDFSIESRTDIISTSVDPDVDEDDSVDHIDKEPEEEEPVEEIEDELESPEVERAIDEKDFDK